MRHQTLVLGILALILIGAILTAGCAARERRGAGINPAPSAIRTPTPPARPTTTPALPGTATAPMRVGPPAALVQTVLPRGMMQRIPSAAARNPAATLAGMRLSRSILTKRR